MKTKQTKIDRAGATLLPGAMALAATTASSQAASVQITLTGNRISVAGGNQLNADFTGDGVNDIRIDGTTVSDTYVVVDIRLGPYSGNGIDAYWKPPGTYYGEPLPNRGASVQARFALENVGWSGRVKDPEVGSSRVLNGITFQDTRINGGSETSAWVEVFAYADSTEQYVEFTRLIFDDASTTRPAFTEIPGTQTEWGAVPEPSSLALLALGAGGLLTRRSRAKAA